MGTEVCLGLRLCVPFWCSFRDPTSSNVHRTFPVPPPATLYGMIAAAFGLHQDDYSRRDSMRFAIAIEETGEIVETYSKWMKAAEMAKDEKQKQAWLAMQGRGLLTPDTSTWVSTPLIRQKLIQPIFAVGILCSPEVAEETQGALRRPFFPLYLGESDDSVDLEFLGIEKPESTVAPATGAIAGVNAGGMLASLPTRFHPAGRGKWTLERWLVTIPKPQQPISTSGADLIACHNHVWSFEPPLQAGNVAIQPGESIQRELF